MNLIRTSAAAWTREMEAEAIRNGYQLVLVATPGGLIARVYNGEILCYQREWHA
jgi:hypothetical protein